MSEHPLQAVWDRCRRLDAMVNEAFKPAAQPRDEPRDGK